MLPEYFRELTIIHFFLSIIRGKICLRELEKTKAAEVGFKPACTELRCEHANTELILHSRKAHGSKYVCFNLVWFDLFLFKSFQF